MIVMRTADSLHEPVIEVFESYYVWACVLRNRGVPFEEAYEIIFGRKPRPDRDQGEKK